MSMNKHMHPRNIYKTPPNFKELAIKYPEFRQYVKQDLSGKISVDFKDINALRALSCTLLKNDFNLDVEIPTDKLIPTIPLRLNYLLWIEDLLDISNRKSDVVGIDIGTGASCVYPLIGAKMFGWKMVATEINDASIEFAVKNIQRNSLQEKINVVKVNEDAILGPVLECSDVVYDFCMCNPPFFASSDELHPFFKARKNSRPHPKNAFCASNNEVIANGGETKFVTQMMNESLRFKDRVKIFTTMLGHKSSLTPLKKKLRDLDVTSFKQTEFCQGNTTRWGLSWTYYEIDLRKIPSNIKNVKSTKPLSHEIRSITLQNLTHYLLKMFTELKFIVEENKHTKNVVIYSITAHGNTWSHQRRKKRLEKRLNSSNSSEESCVASEKMSQCNITDIDSKKRELEDADGYYKPKKIKLGTSQTNNNEDYLKATIVLKNNTTENSVTMELFCIDGNDNREGLHQILQYIKNNLKTLMTDKCDQEMQE